MTILKKLKFKQNFWVLLLILFFIPFRLHQFTSPILDAFNFRQAQTATFTLNFYREGIDLFRTQLDIFGIGPEKYLTLEFPLYEAITASLYRIFYVSDIWGRVVAIISGFVGAYYLFQIVKKVTNKSLIAFFSVFFFLVSPLNMFYQRTFMIESTVISLLLAGTNYYLNWVRSNKWKDYFIALILLTLGFLHKGLYGPFWLLPMAVYYINERSFKKAKSISFLMLLILPLLTLFLWQQYVNTANIQAGHYFFTTVSYDHLAWNFGTISERLSFYAWQFRLQQLVNGTMLKPGLVLFLIGLWGIKSWDKKRFLFFWLLSQAVYFVMLFRIQQQNYYQTVMVPAIASVMAVGLYKILNFSIKIFHRKPLVYLLLAVFCSFYLYKSWLNTLPSFTIDWQWYNRLKKVGDVLPAQSYGILVTPDFDWNSVYTYVTGYKMLLVSVENLSEQKINNWKNEGYSFLLLHDYNKFPEYLSKIKSNLSLDFLKKYRLIHADNEFKAYLF